MLCHEVLKDRQKMIARDQRMELRPTARDPITASKLALAHLAGKKRRRREEDRDISERIALGQAEMTVARPS